MKMNKKKVTGFLLAAACMVGAGALSLNANVASAEGETESTPIFKVASASIRYEGDAMRFAVVMDSQSYDEYVAAGATFGMLIMPTDLIPVDGLTPNVADALNIVTGGESEVSDVVDTVASNWIACNIEGYSDCMMSVVYLTGIDAYSYNRDITMKGYVTTAEGTEYTTNTSNTSLSQLALDTIPYESGESNLIKLNNMVKKYAVNFVDETGATVADQQAVKYGSTFEVPEITAPTGKEVAGYYERIGTDGEGKAVYSETAYDFAAEGATTVKSGKEFKVAYKAIERTVTFKYPTGETEAITATYGTGLASDPAKGYSYSLADIAVTNPYVNDTEVESVSAADFTAITEDTTVEWKYAHAKNMTYDPTTGTVQSVSLAKLAGASYIGLTKTVSGNFMLSADIVDNTADFPCLGFTVYSESGSVQFESSNGTYVRVFKNYKWTGQTTCNASYNVGRTCVADGTAGTFTVAYQDGVVYFYGTGGYMYQWYMDLEETLGEGPYTVGFAAWDVGPELSSGVSVKTDELPLIEISEWNVEDNDLQVAEYVAANDLEVAIMTSHMTIDRTTNTITSGGINQTLRMLKKSANIHLSGTLKQNGEQTQRWQGFQIMADGTFNENGGFTPSLYVNFYIQGTAFAYMPNGSWASPWTYNTISETNPYALYNSGFSGKLNTEFTYDLIISDDVMYLWVNGLLNWKVKLTDTSFGFAAGTLYRVGLITSDQDETGSTKDGVYNEALFGNTSLKLDDAAIASSAQMVKTGAYLDLSANHLNVAYKADGTIRNPNTTSGTGHGKLYFDGTSNALYLDTQLTTKNMDGIFIKSGDVTRQVLFQNTGVAIMTTGWASGFVNYTGSSDMFKTNTFNSGVYADCFYGESAGKTSAFTDKNVTYVISSESGVDYLYILIDGNAFFRIALTEIGFTNGSTYQLGFASWDMKALDVQMKVNTFEYGTAAATNIATAVAKFTA